MSVKFGTSGLRGLSTDLVGSVSALYSTAFARHMLDSGALQTGSPVVIARDFRPSSPEIAGTIMAAIKRLGLQPIDCGTIPISAELRPELCRYRFRLYRQGFRSGRGHRWMDYAIPSRGGSWLLPSWSPDQRLYENG